jgi:MSHA biogenesis protein MshP
MTNPRVLDPKGRGFTLVTAVFLIIVLAVLGVFMVTMLATQRQSTALSIVGARAHFAAQSGMERAVAHVISGGDCSPFPATVALTGGAADGFDVTLSCDARVVTEGPTGTPAYAVYSLSATAELGNPGEPGYVSRTIDATVTEAP